MAIIQKYFQTIHYIEYTNFIYECIKEQFLEITNSKHDVCVVQKYISEGDELKEQK